METGGPQEHNKPKTEALKWTTEEKEKVLQIVAHTGTSNWEKVYNIYKQDGGTRSIASIKSAYKKTKDS